LDEKKTIEEMRQKNKNKNKNKNRNNQTKQSAQNMMDNI